MWIEISLLLFLGVCAVCDGMKKEIPVVVVWLGICTAVVFYLQGAMGERTWWEAVLAMVPGVMFWALSFVSREKVGYGDGWRLMMVGLFVGIWKCFVMLLIGLMAQSLTVLVLIAVKKVGGDQEIPFAPFLFLGTGVLLCCI